MEYLSPKQAVMYHNILKGTDSRNNETNYIEDIENSWDWTL